MSDPTPSLRALCPRLPAGFELVVEKCLIRIGAIATQSRRAGRGPGALFAGACASAAGGAGAERGGFAASLPSTGGTPVAPAVSIPAPATSGTGPTRAA